MIKLQTHKHLFYILYIVNTVLHQILEALNYNVISVILAKLSYLVGVYSNSYGIMKS